MNGQHGPGQSAQGFVQHGGNGLIAVRPPHEQPLEAAVGGVALTESSRAHVSRFGDRHAQEVEQGGAVTAAKSLAGLGVRGEHGGAFRAGGFHNGRHEGIQGAEAVGQLSVRKDAQRLVGIYVAGRFGEGLVSGALVEHPLAEEAVHGGAAVFVVVVRIVEMLIFDASRCAVEGVDPADGGKFNPGRQPGPVARRGDHEHGARGHERSDFHVGGAHPKDRRVFA